IILLNKHVNFLLIVVPLGIAAGKLDWSPIVVVTLNFFTTIPLAAVILFATKEYPLNWGISWAEYLRLVLGILLN
ncbi:hypothetical protein BKA56DRAFT_262727, partial [Ilyonectria sp. MPI-CAGE-AT-0026]